MATGPDREAFAAFTAQRISSAGSKQYIRKNLPNAQSKKLQKLIRYNHADDRMRAKLDVSRSTEWNKWKKFNAAVPIGPAKLKELLDEGHSATPMQPRPSQSVIMGSWRAVENMGLPAR